MGFVFYSPLTISKCFCQDRVSACFGCEVLLFAQVVVGVRGLAGLEFGAQGLGLSFLLGLRL